MKDYHYKTYLNSQLRVARPDLWLHFTFTWVFMISILASLKTCCKPVANSAYSTSLKSMPGKTSLTNASNCAQSANVSFDMVLSRKAWTTIWLSLTAEKQSNLFPLLVYHHLKSNCQNNLIIFVIQKDYVKLLISRTTVWYGT